MVLANDRAGHFRLLDINRVDLATSRRDRIRELGPQDRAAVVKVLAVALARDGVA